MAILWIVFGLIGFGLWGLMFVFLIELGGGNMCWPWENCHKWDKCIYAVPVAGGQGNITGDKQTSSDMVIKDAQNRAVQTGIYAGAVLIRSYRDDQRGVDRLTRGLELAQESGISDNVKRSEQALEDGRKRRDITFEIYMDQLRKSAEYPVQQNEEQLDDLKLQFRQRKDMKPFERFAELFVSQVEAYKRNNTADEGKLAGQILESYNRNQ